jgi:hypothetical protein
MRQAGGPTTTRPDDAADDAADDLARRRGRRPGPTMRPTTPDDAGRRPTTPDDAGRRRTTRADDGPTTGPDDDELAAAGAPVVVYKIMHAVHTPSEAQDAPQGVWNACMILVERGSE